MTIPRTFEPSIAFRSMWTFRIDPGAMCDARTASGWIARAVTDRSASWGATATAVPEQAAIRARVAVMLA
jgi:hypothetical protein